MSQVISQLLQLIQAGGGRGASPAALGLPQFLAFLTQQGDGGAGTASRNSSGGGGGSGGLYRYTYCTVCAKMEV